MNSEKIISVLSIFIPFIILSYSFHVYGNGGWWNKMKQPTSCGSPYSMIDHPDIALEKEVILCKGVQLEKDETTYLPKVKDSGWHVEFLFRNTSSKAVTVDVGFPVEVLVGETRGKGRFLLADYPKGPYYKIFLEKLFKGKFKKIKIDKDFNDTVIGGIVYKKHWNDSITNSSTMNFSTFKNSQLADNTEISIDIVQDGKIISIDSVLLESLERLSPLSEKQKDIYMVFHFVFKLSFKPGSYSNVIVDYTVPSWTSAASNGDYHNWKYILETGRTWKGHINKVYLLIPSEIKEDATTLKLPESFMSVGNVLKHHLYLAEDYEPSISDSIDIGYGIFIIEKTWDYHYESDFEYDPHLLKTSISELFKINGASSYSKGISTVYSFEKLKQKKSYKPKMLFDNNPESSWCVEAPGIQEWVEFELKEDTWGIMIQNGFKKIPFENLESINAYGKGEEGTYNMSFFSSDNLAGEKDIVGFSKLFSAFEKNNRIKTIEFVSKDKGTKKMIKLSNTRKKQAFSDFQLSKGKYKMFIKDIYEASDALKTCLGELQFSFYSQKAKEEIIKDKFLKAVVHRQLLGEI